MTKPIGGEVIEAAARPDLLAPGTVRRPAWISEDDWARMPWPAKWKAARRAVEAAPKLHRRHLEPAPDLPEHQAEARRILAEIEGLRPCGTRSAAVRHRQYGEKPCDACLAAERMDSAIRWRRTKRKRASSPSDSEGTVAS